MSNKSLSTTVQQALATKRQNMAERLAGLGGGEAMPFIKAKAKHFIFPDGDKVPTELSVVVLDWAFHFGYWEKEQWNPGDSDPPVCVAVGQVAKTLAPASTSPKPQHDLCATCPHNQWDSGKNGGKRCKNTINLAVMRYDEEVEDDTIYFISVPPASLKEWGAYDKALIKKGLDAAQVVTVITFDSKSDYTRFKFSADRKLTQEYREEDEDGNSYMASFLENLPKATESLLREPSFRSDDD